MNILVINHCLKMGNSMEWTFFKCKLWLFNFLLLIFWLLIFYFHVYQYNHSCYKHKIGYTNFSNILFYFNAHHNSIFVVVFSCASDYKDEKTIHTTSTRRGKQFIQLKAHQNSIFLAIYFSCVSDFKDDKMVHTTSTKRGNQFT